MLHELRRDASLPTMSASFNVKIGGELKAKMRRHASRTNWAENVRRSIERRIGG
ncbi:MAG: hypothetical protein QW518_04030 [Thermofilaceae archaeon]